LNDVTVDETGAVYVSDSSATKIYKVAPDRSYTLFAQGEHVNGVNGLAVQGDTVWMTAGSQKKVISLDQAGKKTGEKAVPAGGLDGLVVLEDGAQLVSSWDAHAVYHAPADGAFAPLLTDLSSPADIGYDTKRNLILVPLFDENKMIARPMAQ